MNIKSRRDRHVLLADLAFPESPRWHDGRLWISDWGANEVIAVDPAGQSEVVARVGFALIGLWLIALNWSTGSASGWPRQLRNLGLVAGIVMALGIVVAPGIAMGVDDANTAPGWIWIGFVGWLGIFFLYPIWSIWFGNAPAQRWNRGRHQPGIDRGGAVLQADPVGGDDIERPTGCRCGAYALRGQPSG